MKDFRFLSAVAPTEDKIPAVMESLLAPFEGKIVAFHHDITMRGQQFVISYTIQLATSNVQSNGSSGSKKAR